jgi:enoyl-CoA hydratase/carnithine racemase
VFGGGVELVLSCDFIVAATDATFRQIEVSVGNMPMAGGVQRMAERIGRSRAVLYAMLSLPMTGETAGELGLASFVVPEEDVEAKALDLVQELANGPTRSYAAVRQILKAWSAGGVAGADAVMLDVALRARATIEPGEAAWDLLNRLAKVYVAPDAEFPAPKGPGYIVRYSVERIGGVGPWLPASH